MGQKLKVEKVDIFIVPMELKYPFTTSFGTEKKRRVVIVSLESGDLKGWGECTAGEGPWYSYETVDTAVHIAKEFLVPLVLKQEFNNPTEFYQRISVVRGNNMIKAAFEEAFWDLYAKSLGKPLYVLLGGVRTKIFSGVSIGIKGSIDELIRHINMYLNMGYRRIKIKIKPGWDIEVVRQVRRQFPETPLQVDANAAYDISYITLFEELDKYNLLMIEQPFHYEDLVDHAYLQKRIGTPICLDESIHSIHLAKAAIALGSTRVINIKPGRVGGIIQSKEIHDYAKERNIPVWIGGMLESGIGRAHLVALATLPNVRYPNDVSASDRYYHEDIVEPEFKLNKDGTIRVPNGPGIGVEVKEEFIEENAIDIFEWS